MRKAAYIFFLQITNLRHAVTHLEYSKVINFRIRLSSPVPVNMNNSLNY